MSHNLSLHPMLPPPQGIGQRTKVVILPTSGCMALCGTEDPEKAFSPCTRSLVHGVVYDTEKLDLADPAPENVCRFVHQIRVGVLAAESVTQAEIWSLAGRIMHYEPLIPGGRLNLCHIMAANAKSDDREAPSRSTACSEEAAVVLAYNGQSVQRLPPHSQPVLPAAGLGPGFLYRLSWGVHGQLSMERRADGVAGSWWFQVPWGTTINGGTGQRTGRRSAASSLLWSWWLPRAGCPPV
jgi:hypothetical protein